MGTNKPLGCMQLDLVLHHRMTSGYAMPPPDLICRSIIMLFSSIYAYSNLFPSSSSKCAIRANALHSRHVYTITRAGPGLRFLYATSNTCSRKQAAHRTQTKSSIAMAHGQWNPRTYFSGKSRHIWPVQQLQWNLLTLVYVSSGLYVLDLKDEDRPVILHKHWWPFLVSISSLMKLIPNQLTCNRPSIIKCIRIN